MTRQTWIYIAIGVLVAGALIAVFHLGRSCAPAVIIEQPITEVDTTEVDEATRQAQELAKQEADKMIHDLETEHAEDLKDFDEKQREEYEEVREEGPDAVAKWLSDFNKGLKER